MPAADDFLAELEQMNPSENEIMQAYADGLSAIRQKAVKYTGSVQDIFFLMPLSVLSARGNPPPTERWPSYDELSANDRLAVRILFHAMLFRKYTGVKYPKFMQPAVIFECDIDSFLLDPVDRALTAKDLLAGDRPRLLNALRHAIQIVHEVNAVKIPDNWESQPQTGVTGAPRRIALAGGGQIRFGGAA